ncbi:hypothetical protein GCM10007874_18910 [Labrys miyagiensis]|uniref:ABM domain-containing protein n=1 Tax=Labrys miyagiensis TaxID=346912 RepID=A0ABQ6CGH1_9HYPH|nr:antibiotic biosynthesis monooxygenase [Labrys miyagiensis]GLS18874.1 hypothetical protein GCM10007874_18910 [Labrys miyagiensis]
MSIQATNLHHTKPGRAAELLAALQRALPDTIAHGGCEEIRLCRDQDNENKVISITRWTSRAAYEEYLAWQEGKGDTARFREMLIKDMEVSFYDEVFVIKPDAPTNSMRNESLVEVQKEVVRQFFLRNSAGEIPRAVALFRDDATYWLPTTRETLGTDKLPEALKFVQSRLDGPIRYEIGTMVAEPKRIAVQLEGFAKTVEGAAYNNLYHVYFEFEGEKIVRVREYNDTAHVFDTLRAGQRRRIG